MVAATHRVSEAEAATSLPELLDRVMAGEGVLIEREGASSVRLVAEVVPAPASEAGLEASHADSEQRSPVEVVKEMQRKFGGMFGDATLEEVMSWKHKDHRFG